MQEIEKMAQQGLRYLLEHPQASDPLEGFAGYWMRNQKLRESVTQFRKALMEPEALGEVSEGSNELRSRENLSD